MGEGSRVGMFGKMQSRSMMKLYQCQFSDFPRLSTEGLLREHHTHVDDPKFIDYGHGKICFSAPEIREGKV